ncbi:hypothetical protein [Wukongibacter sp. M2B1]
MTWRPETLISYRDSSQGSNLYTSRIHRSIGYLDMHRLRFTKIMMGFR